MERRGFGFFTKRSQHYDNLQQPDSQQKLPLKDTTNTNSSTKQKFNNNEEESTTQEPESTTTQRDSNEPNSNQQASRSLQCLETLAQKAGIHDITADDCKYDIANTLLNLDRGHENFKQEITTQSGNMSEIKSQQQQMAEANAQAQAQAQAQQVQVVQQQQQQQQQQQLQQVALQQEQQTLAPPQSPHLQQVTVATSMGPPQHTVSMHQQVAQQGQVIQTQGGQVLTAAQSNSATITTMSPLQQTQAHPQQISADWSGRVQVIQQPLQNPTYLQQVYNPQGQLALMPGNILHPGLNPQQIQVIAKPFQGNHLAPHMLTTSQGKHVLQGSQAATFPGYTTIPAIPTTQNQQTLLVSQLGVISSQPNILPNHSAAGNGQVTQQKQQEMHKPGGQPMQFAAPWQFTNGLPQVWTTNGMQSQLLTPTIFMRGATQPDGSPGPGMFIPQGATIQTQQNPVIATQGTVQQISKPRPTNENIQPKQPVNRPLNILPSNTANIRPASSVATQTIGAQTPASMGGKLGPKNRIKAPQIRSPAPKTDASNQTQMKTYQMQQQQQQQQIQQQQHHIVGNKMVVMNSTGMTTVTPGSPMTIEKTQQLIAQKAQQMQQQQSQQQNTQQSQQQQVQQQSQQAVLMQQQAIQQHAMQQLQFQQGQPQHIQPKSIMMQTIQGIPQQQIQMTGDRPIMPVVSMSQAGTQVQQTIPGNIQQSLPMQPNLAVTHQQMPMGMLHSMAPPGTLIGSIQTSTQATAMQVTATSSQVQQLQSGTSQTLTLPGPQQVPLPPTVPSVKMDQSEIPAADNLSQTVMLQEIADTKTNIHEAISTATVTPSQADIKLTLPLLPEQTPISSSAATLTETTGVQAVPIPGTVPSQLSNVIISDSGLPIATTAEEVKERCPPKAMVKPQVLTHVIEDFVIQESSEPFPVTKGALLGEFKGAQTIDKDNDEPPRKKRASTPSSNGIGMSPKGEMAKCEACGTIDLRAKFKKNKRFCSLLCAKSGKYKDDKKEKWTRGEDGAMDVDADSGASGAESSSSPTEDDDTPKVDPLKWTVQEVCDFIKNLPGCSDYAEDFLIQEIDGQALMLLKEDHLMTAMAMKLGPALKIVAKIDDMRIDKEPPKQN